MSVRERLDESIRKYNLEYGHYAVVKNASCVLSKEYATDEKYRKAVVLSVESALKDAFRILMMENVFEPSEYRTIARKVADRVYGSD